MTQLTPMMAQYQEIKAMYTDYILFFRLGDFYEMFFDDAVVASKVLEITLTKRNAGAGQKAPLCGVPYHAADQYIAKMVQNGYKVAICEQVEDPALAKGIVKREVVRIVTPGTVIDPSMLDEKNNNFIAALIQDPEGYGLAYADVTTGLLKTTSFVKEDLQTLLDEWLRLKPSETLLIDGQDYPKKIMDMVRPLSLPTYRDERYFSFEASGDALKKHYSVSHLDGLGLSGQALMVKAAGGLLHYIQETQKMELMHFKQLEVYQLGQHMMIDTFTRINLELTETMRGKEKRGSLQWVLDKTKTAMGSRLLKQWIEAPLIQLEPIQDRLDSVKYLYTELLIRSDLRDALDEIYDLERLMAKAVFGSLNARDCVALKSSLAVLPLIHSLLSDADSLSINQMMSTFDPLSDLYDLLDQSIVEDPPFSIREGGLFKDGYNAELDALRDAISNGKKWLLDIETRERERTGIKNLKIGFNRVFGYYIEITKSNVKQAPEDYHRKQTLANAERYIMPELKTIEDKILGAEERINKLEYELFLALKENLLKGLDRMRHMAHVISQIDVLASFAEVSERNGYVPPTLNTSETLKIKEGRHPVVERISSDERFVPNHTRLDTENEMVCIVTGPNMAGKSTYLRQVALITLMAQIGCFVPAVQAEVGIVDRIFTRVGASDDLFHGQSTFMVEMHELANILNHATHRSLIILDEIGRGTSTYDGLSIAWSVVEFIANHLKAKTIFATHYHELTELEGKIDGVKNYCISVEEVGDDIIFLRKIIRGGANQSFGIQVAKLAGVPQAVIKRAKHILLELEDSDITRTKASIIDQPAKQNQETDNPMQLSFEALLEDSIVQTLKEININDMTPLHSMNTLHELIEKANKR